MRGVLALTLLLAGAALGQEVPLTGPAFEARVTGKTLTYARDNQIYGREQYLPGRRVIWAFEGDTCRMGVWYEAQGAICFDYDTYDQGICWEFFDRGPTLAARLVGDEPVNDLILVDETDAPINCPLPGLGA